MRTLLLLRGAPGCGKSTWIEKHGLKPYTLSADDLRMLCESPNLTPDGSFSISGKNEGVVWKILFQLVEQRMKNGDFTVIDATNSKTVEMNRYKNLASQYRYRIFCVDFTDIPIELVKSRNKARAEYKQVPDEAIDKMYSRFATQKIPSGIKVLSPDDFVDGLEPIDIKPLDLSHYSCIHHIGDIHGCYTALKEYIDKQGGIKDDECWIFCGDYIDRGTENVEVIKFLQQIAGRENIMLLEGNHERWLRDYGKNVPSASKQFELVTAKELADAGITRKEVRILSQKFIQCAYYTYHGKTVLVTHGGLSGFGGHTLLTIPASQMIKGVGKYEDSDLCDRTFCEQEPDTYQIHGHRNISAAPIQTTERTFNLEGGVEFGGSLRCVQLAKDGFTAIETPNTLYIPEKQQEELKTTLSSDVANIVMDMRKHRNVSEKQYGDISSFNFTSRAFRDGDWDKFTSKARGLYIDTKQMQVVARAYDKFFNINERPETLLGTLKHSLKFPVDCYVKENGFLGIISYDEEIGGLRYSTKSSLDGDHAIWFRKMVERTLSPTAIDMMISVCRDYNISMLFECVDMTHDPHIIEYHKNHLFLLDAIKNNITFKKLSYDFLMKFGDSIGCKVKKKARTINSWQEFYQWYNEVTAPCDLYSGDHIEGYVIEDSAGFMTKLKLPYYSFWKFMRSISDEVIRKGYSERTSALLTPEANTYYGWIKDLRANTKPEDMPHTICELRRLFLADHGKQKN